MKEFQVFQVPRTQAHAPPLEKWVRVRRFRLKFTYHGRPREKYKPWNKNMYGIVSECMWSSFSLSLSFLWMHINRKILKQVLCVQLVSCVQHRPTLGQITFVLVGMQLEFKLYAQGISRNQSSMFMNLPGFLTSTCSTALDAAPKCSMALIAPYGCTSVFYIHRKVYKGSISWLQASKRIVSEFLDAELEEEFGWPTSNTMFILNTLSRQYT